MAREPAGIEIFGRRATVVDTSPRARAPRTAALGAGSVLVAIVAAAAFAAAVIERARGTDLVELFIWIAMVASVVAVAMGIAAAVTGRGRFAGFLGALLGLVANPWLLGRVLELAAGLSA